MANDGSTESLINLLKGNINLYELRDSKLVIREIVRFYKMGAEVILELVTEGEQGEPLKRFVGYDMMREYYPRELLRFLERQRAAVIWSSASFYLHTQNHWWLLAFYYRLLISTANATALVLQPITLITPDYSNLFELTATQIKLARQAAHSKS